MQNYTSSSEIECQQKATNDECELTPDAIAFVNSGHLGMPLECSKIGGPLFWKLLRINSLKPTLINRDGLLLSAYYGSKFL